MATFGGPVLSASAGVVSRRRGNKASAAATAGLLDKSRPQLKQDVEDLTGLARTLNSGRSTIDGVLQRFPDKIATLTPGMTGAEAIS